LCAKRLIASLRPTLHFFARGRDEAVKARQIVQGIVFAFEAGRDGFWLARWLRARGRRFLSKATFS
jgi:transposase